MQIKTQNGKKVIVLSAADWTKIGQQNGWLTAQTSDDCQRGAALAGELIGCLEKIMKQKMFNLSPQIEQLQKLRSNLTYLGGLAPKAPKSPQTQPKPSGKDEYLEGIMNR